MKRLVFLGGLWFFACSGGGVRVVDGSSDEETASESSRDTESVVDVEAGESDSTDEVADTADTQPEFETDSQTLQPVDTGDDSGEDTQTAETQTGESGDQDTLQGEKTVEFTLQSEKDAVSSYLMDADYSAWNYFFGDSVPMGKRWSSFGDSVSYHTALRFADVDIPRGAEILSAELYLTPLSSVQNSRNLWINIYAEQSGGCSAFDTGNYETNRPDQRLRTDKYIDHWLVRCNDSCTDSTEYDCQQRKLDCWTKDEEIRVPKDLKDIVGEVVALDDWVSGNAMCLFLFNAATDQDGSKYQDSRTIIGYPGPDGSGAPRLRVVYTE
jgi:hypothetical protein